MCLILLRFPSRTRVPEHACPAVAPTEQTFSYIYVCRRTELLTDHTDAQAQGPPESVPSGTVSVHYMCTILQLFHCALNKPFTLLNLRHPHRTQRSATTARFCSTTVLIKLMFPLVNKCPSLDEFTGCNLVSGTYYWWH